MVNHYFSSNGLSTRYVKAFDYPSLASSISECFQDFRVVIPPEPTGFTRRSLPSLYVIPPTLTEELKVAQGRLAQWSAEILKLNELCQPDRQIADITSQGQAAQLSYKGINSRLQVLQITLTTTAQRNKQLATKIEKLAKYSIAQIVTGVCLFPVAIGSCCFIATKSEVFSFATALGTMAFALMVYRFYNRVRRNSTSRTLKVSADKADQLEVEINKLIAAKKTVESSLNELSIALKSLRQTHSDKVERFSPLLANAENARKLAQEEVSLKQSALDLAQAELRKSMELRKQEHERRVGVVRTLEYRRTQILSRLRALSCPAPVQEWRRQFHDAKIAYERVQGLYSNELNRVRRCSRERQLTEFLEKYSIEKMRPGDWDEVF